MTYTVFFNGKSAWCPALCPSIEVADAVSKDYRLTEKDQSGTIAKQEEHRNLCLDMGGAIWAGAEVIRIPLGDGLPDFSFFSHHLKQVWSQVYWNYRLVAETGYVKFYGNIFSVCLSEKQANKVFLNLRDNYDMYQIVETTSRNKLSGIHAS